MDSRALAFLVLAACAVPQASPPPGLQAGAAVIDLTPSRPVPLAGYGGRKGKPMTGVHDPVYAKALWLETKEAKVCIVTTDLIGSLITLRDQARPEGASLVLAASHNHSGPGALARGLWQMAVGNYDAAFYEEMVQKIKEVVEAARAARRPARIAFARGAAPELVRNRRSKDGPVDPEIHVMVVSDEVSRPLAVVTNFTAHGTILSDENFLVSGDWQGAFQRALEARLGGVALYLNGAEGDVAPRAPSGRDAFERCRSMGEALAEKVEILARGVANGKEQVKLRYVERGVDLKSPTLPLAPTKSVVGLLEIDGARMFCFPGEPCVELGLELKRRFPGAWIVGLANDHLGYFLTEEDFKKGGYESRMSFYGPRLGPWLVEQLASLGEGEHAQDRAREPEGRRR